MVTYLRSLFITMNLYLLSMEGTVLYLIIDNYNSIPKDKVILGLILLTFMCLPITIGSILKILLKIFR